MSQIIQPNQFAEWLSNHLATSIDTNTIDLIPAPCGIGKSFSMTMQIAEALQSNDLGILLVTDEVERMQQYANPESYDESLGAYLAKNSERILVYTASNAKIDRGKLYSKQIVIMSTQRFFNLSREEVLNITDKYKPKRNILIDERAPLTETIRVDISTFNDIDTALRKQIDNTARDKDWLIQQWGNLRTRYAAFMDKYEADNNDTLLQHWHIDDDKHATTDDERFLDLVNSTHASKLRKADNEILKKIRAIFEIVANGALFISRKKPDSKSSNEYSNTFYPVIDHSDLLLDVGSKSVILDGTGLYDPIYSHWAINRINCDDFKRDLSKLTINIVNINTSRNTIAKSPANNQHLNAIIDYVKSIPRVDAVFTYGRGKEDTIAERATVEREFANAGFKTGHFGALKGKNCYREMTDFVQVGLNRIPDEFYLAQAVANIFNRYKPYLQHYGVCNVIGMTKLCMCRSILADIEQNIFRGVIRNADNQQLQTYTLIYRCNSEINKCGIERNDLAELTAMIRERYEPLGATVNVIDTPPNIQRLKSDNRKTKDGSKTAAQKVSEFLDQMQHCPGEVFKRADILAACNINDNQYKHAIGRNPHIKQRLDRIKCDVQGYYKFPAATHNGYDIA